MTLRSVGGPCEGAQQHHQAEEETESWEVGSAFAQGTTDFLNYFCLILRSHPLWGAVLCEGRFAAMFDTEKKSNAGEAHG